MAMFTDKMLRGLKPREASYEERDHACPGLLIRVGARGKKVFEVIVADGGKRRRVRLGVFPDLSLAMARRLAADAKAAPNLHTGGMRVRDLWEQYAAEKRPVRRSFSDVERAWKLWAEPRIGDVRLEDIGMRHGADLIAHVAKQVSPDRARHVIRYISPMLTYAAGRGMLPGNPWAGLSLPEGATERDRVLTLDEWRALAAWASSAAYPYGPFVKLLMLSAQRLREVAGIQWADVHESVIELPAARYKSGRRHELPISEGISGVLRSLPRHDTHLFSTREGKSIVPGSKLKARMDVETGVTNWRFHDIRRTAATLMSEGGIHRFTIERVLGHADTGVTARYDRHNYRKEKLEALELLTEITGRV